MKFNVFFSVMVLAIVGFSGLSSCKDDAEDCANWANDLQDELTAMQNAATTYGTNPTTANCNAYKDAVQDYIDEAESFRDCDALTGADRDAWEQALETAQDNLDNFNC